MTDTLDVPNVRDTARDNLTRSVDFRAEPSTDGLNLDGYAATFRDWTEITDRLGTFREQIAPGSFKRTLAARTPVLQFDHGAHPLIGSIPLGRITKISEDDQGLRVRSRLSDNWLIEPVRDAIRDEAVTGMSFRFRVVVDSWETIDDVEHRTIEEVELYEVGPVVFPAYDTTSVGVRSRQTALALVDPEVRSEVAALMTLGTDDLRHLAESSPADPGTSDAPVVETPPPGHASTPYTKSKRRAIAALLIKE